MSEHQIVVTDEVCPLCSCGYSPPGHSMESLWRNALFHVDMADPMLTRITAGIRQYCSDLNTELSYHEPTRDTTLLDRFHDDAFGIAYYITEVS